MNNIPYSIGRMGEDFVSDFLTKKGFSILCRNYRIKGGEIDIIASDNTFLVFTEVKTRKYGSPAGALEAVDNNKIKRIIKTAQHYIWETAADLQPRYDTAEIIYSHNKIISMNYIENAFFADSCSSDYIF